MSTAVVTQSSIDFQSNAVNDSAPTRSLPWFTKRTTIPFQGAEARLHFNYWMECERIEGRHVVDLLEYLTDPDAPLPQDSFLDEEEMRRMREQGGPRQLVVVNLQGFEQQALQRHYEDLRFFPQSSSVPFLAAMPSETSRAVGDNPNAWFYGDVRAVGATLLSPKVRPIPADQLDERDLDRLLRDYQLRFELRSSFYSPRQLMVQFFDAARVQRDLDLIFSTTSASFEANEDFNPEDSKYKIVQHFLCAPSRRYGRVLMVKDASYEAGLCILDTSDAIRASFPQLAPNKLVLLVFWNRSAAFDILETCADDDSDANAAVDSSPNGVRDMLRMRSSETLSLDAAGDNNAHAAAPLDAIEISLSAAVPLPEEMRTEAYYTGESASAATPSPAVQETDIDTRTDTIAGTVTAPESVLSVDALRQSYAEIETHAHVLERLVLSRDVLQMLGFLTSPEHSGFKDTANPLLWPALRIPGSPSVCDDSPSLSPLEIDSAKATTHIVAGSMVRTLQQRRSEDVEEGEEVEEDVTVVALSAISKKRRFGSITTGVGSALDASESARFLHQSVHNKLSREAIHYFGRPSAVENDDMLSYPLDLCAIDCEMCSSKHGLELTRITVVHPRHGIVLDTLVKPRWPITDYHTEFSGINAQSLEKITVNFEDIISVLRVLIGKYTIIVGHSLDTDLKVLQLVHARVIDTAALFPHNSALPYKIALKTLAKDYLGVDIQDGEEGHDSVEDSIAALQLVLLLCKRFVDGEDIFNFPAKDSSSFRLQMSSYHIRHNLQEHLFAKPSTADWRVVTFAPRVFAQRAYWERDALGYRRDTCVSAMLHAHTSVAEGSFEEDLQRLRAEMARQTDSRNNAFYWLDVDMHNSSDEEDSIDEDSSKKRSRKHVDALTPDVKSVDAQLQSLYESLPENSLLLVFTQESLVPLKKLIAKKMRLKWDLNSIQKHKSRVSMPNRDRTLGRLENEFDSKNDEALLVKSSHAAASCTLFIRQKK